MIKSISTLREDANQGHLDGDAAVDRACEILCRTFIWLAEGQSLKQRGLRSSVDEPRRQFFQANSETTEPLQQDFGPIFDWLLEFFEKQERRSYAS